LENLSKYNQIILKLSNYLVVDDDSLIDGLISESLKNVAEFFDADRALILLTDPTKNSFSAAREWHIDQLFPLKKTLQSLYFRDYMIWGKFKVNQQTLLIPDTENIPESYPFDSKLFRDAQCRSFLQKALVLDNETIGFLTFLRKYDSKIVWNDQTVQMLAVIGELFKSLILKIRSKKSVSEQKVDFQLPAFRKESESIRFFDQVFGNLSFGIALFDTVIQKFVYANNRIYDLCSIAEKDKTLTDMVFKVFQNNGYNVDDFFSTEHKREIKDFTLAHDGRYLSGSVNPVEGTSRVVLSIADITPIANYEKAEKSLNFQMKQINEAAIELISPEREEKDMFQFIGKTAYSLASDSVVLVNKYFPEQGYLKTVYVEGLGSSVGLIAQLLGKHPLNKTYPLEVGSDSFKEVLSLRSKEMKDGLFELSFGALPKPVAIKIEKTLGVLRVFSCGLFVNEELYGTINFLFRSENEINFYVMETYARLISSALNGFETGKKLRKTTRTLADAAHLARIGTWEYDFNERKFCISKNLFKKLETDFDILSTTGDVHIPEDEFLNRYTRDSDRKKIKELLETAYKNRKKEKYSLELEFTLVLPTGKTVYIYTRGLVIKHKKITGVAQDISEIKKVEKNLWESELKFQNLVEQSLDAIVVIKEDGIITEWNSRAKEITGLEPEQVIGKHAWEIESSILFNPLIPKKHPQQTPAKLKNRFFAFFESNLTRKPFQTEITIRTPKNEIRYLSVTSFVFIANQQRFLCRISKDITLEKQKQEYDKQMEIMQKTAKAKELFLDNMSHEMRTPLSGIIGMTDILLHTRLNEQQNEMLKVVKESSDTLLDLISSIHELSRLEAEGVYIQKKPFRVSMMMEKSISVFRASALQKSLDLVLNDESPSNIMLVGDEFRLRQIIGNLIGNAIKFTPPGGKVEVIVKTHRVNSTYMQLNVRVEDTGIGIEKEKLPILFDKFTQVDSSYTREYEGIGIGLSICRELIKLMGGDIGVTSEHRKGSAFWIHINLPFKDD
jgi:PAS domain S-box-containing protein